MNNAISSVVRTRIVIAVMLALATAAQAADEPPTAEELAQLQEKKDWQNLLLGTTKVLTLRGQAAAGYDRVTVWMQKAEAQLQSGQFVPASQSFAKAADEKSATPEQKDLAEALSRLLKKSDNKGYNTPTRQGASKTFDVLDPEKRKEALAALLSADLADAQQRTEQLAAAMEAKPLVDLVKQIADVRPIDRAVNKSSDQADALEITVGTNFVGQVTKWSDTAKQRLNEIKAEAEQIIQTPYKDRQGLPRVRQRRQGLTGPNAQDLQKLMQRAEHLAGAYQPIQQAMTEPGKTALKPAEAAIQSVYDLAKQIKTDAARPMPVNQ